jgi:endoglucanase
MKPDQLEESGGTDISNLSSMELVRQMGAGWNLGNTLDAHWHEAAPWINNPSPAQQETLWGNPVTTKAMIDKLKADGFKTIRVPVTWYIFTGPAPNYTIKKEWMDRVQQIVDYVIDNGMYCILNTHHEDYLSYNGGINGWLRLHGSGTTALTSAERQEMNKRFAGIWKQIADRFKDYDEYLIFEGLNEPRAQNGFSDTTAVWASIYDVLNELLQTFVTTVRESGGNNSVRHLMVTPYFAQFDLHGGNNKMNLFIDSTAKKLKVNDPKNRLIVSLHYYEPYYFAGADPRYDQNSMSTYNNSSGHIPYNNGKVIDVLKTITDYGIPIVMGETGALDKNNEAERVKWANDYVKRVQALGVPVVVWDDGGSFKLLNRNPLSWHFPGLAAAFVNAAK